jgi:hypothetical protein
MSLFNCAAFLESDFGEAATFAIEIIKASEKEQYVLMYSHSIVRWGVATSIILRYDSYLFLSILLMLMLWLCPPLLV